MTRALIPISVGLLIAAGVLALIYGPESGRPRRPKTPDSARAEAEPGIPDTADAAETAEPTAAIEGIVEIAITAKPIEGALVEVTAEGATGPIGAQRPLVGSARTAADGSFRIEAAPTLRALTVTVSARGFYPRLHVFVLRPDAVTAWRVHSRLDPAGVLEGSVYDPDGRPVAGARVCVVPKVRIYQHHMEAGHADRGGYAPNAVTGADGSYEVTGIPLDGHYLAMAWKSPWARIRIWNGVPMYLDSRNPIRRQDFRLRRTGDVVLHVFGPGGSPVTGATIYRGYTSLGCDLPEKVKVEGPGIYRLGGRHEDSLPLYVIGRPFAIAELSVPVPAGDTAHVSVHLEHGVTAVGTIVDDLGRPVAGAEVRARREGHGGLLSGGPPIFDGTEEERLPSRTMATTDERGRFVLQGLRGGRHVFEAMAAGHLGAQGKEFEAPAEDLRIVLRRAATIRFRLEPEVPEARVRWTAAQPYHPANWVGTTTLDRVLTAGADGGFEIPDCATGANPLQILVPGHTVLRSSATLSAGQSVDLGVLRLDPGVDLTGQVLGDAGKPLPGATVHTLEHWHLARRSTRTDKDGRFTLSHLPPGKVAIQAHYPGYESRTTALKDPAVVQLGRSSRGLAIVTVVNSKGVSVPGARVKFHYPDGKGGFKRHNWLDVYSSATGEARWHSGPGKYFAYLVRHPKVSTVVEVETGKTTRYRLVHPD